MLAVTVKVVANVQVMLFEFVPGAGNTLLLNFSQDGVEGALDDVLAFGLGVAFRKFYFFAGVFVMGLSLGEGVLGFLRWLGGFDGLFLIVFLLANEAGDAILAKVKRNFQREGMLHLRTLCLQHHLLASLLLLLPTHLRNF